MVGISSIIQAFPIVKDFIFNWQVKMTILGEPADEYRDQKVLERLPKYITIKNLSTNRLPSSILDIEFILDGKDTMKRKENINFLNPNEFTQILFGINWLIDSRPDLFERQTQGDTTKVAPKEPMKVKVKLALKIWKFYEIQKDEYYMEFGSFKNYPRFQDHPVILLWNKRGNNLIFKT